MRGLKRRIKRLEERKTENPHMGRVVTIPNDIAYEKCAFWAFVLARMRSLQLPIPGRIDLNSTGFQFNVLWIHQIAGDPNPKLSKRAG